MKKKIYAGLLTGAFCLLQAMSVWAGSWQQDNAGRWYQNDDGTYPKGQWQEIDGERYHFDGQGYAQENWYRESGKMYWLEPGGALVRNRDILIDGRYYRADGNGNCTALSRSYSGWLKYDKGWWYRESNGSYPANAWKQIKEKYYRFNGEGYMQTGWFMENGNTYWLGDDGAMAAGGVLTIEGREYTFDDSGAVVSLYKQPAVIPLEAEKTEIQHANDAMADQILAGIVNDGMSEREKAAAIYRWVRGNLHYGVSGTVGDWSQAAYEGLRRRRGNCYTYYATSLELLSRVGIPSIEVIRSTDGDHWWNLVYVDGSWYHFDTTPRTAGGDFCLLTTAQLMDYSNQHHYSHYFDQDLYPPTP